MQLMEVVEQEINISIHFIAASIFLVALSHSQIDNRLSTKLSIPSPPKMIETRRS